MTLALNTSHALYTNITDFIAVDGGALKDLKNPSRTFAVNAAASFGTGALGAHLRTTYGGYTAQGASISPAISAALISQAVTVLAVFNNIPATGQGGYVFGSTTGNTYLMNIDVGPAGAGPSTGYTNSANYDSTVVLNNGPHMLGISKAAGDTLNMQLAVDGVFKTTQNTGYTSDGGSFDYLGGYPGQGSLGADFVYVVKFNKVLTQAEQADLYASLGANNTFGLLLPPAVVTTINATVGNAAASSPNATITSSGLTTVACAVGNISATCPAASVATLLMTDYIINNTGTRRAAQAVSYSWFPGGRIGSFVGIAPLEGAGTTDSNGRLVPGITRATGVLLTCVRNADATADDVYYEAFA